MLKEVSKANSVDPDQTAPIGAVCSGSMLFASILKSSEMLGNYLQQTNSADDIFRCIFFFLALYGLTSESTFFIHVKTLNWVEYSWRAVAQLVERSMTSQQGR